MPEKMNTKSLIHPLLIFIILKCATIQVALRLGPAKEDASYNVQPLSVYYADVPAEDIIYFNGSTIEFSCDVFCVHECQSLIFYNNTFLLLDGYSAPFDYEAEVYKSEHYQNHTLKIIKANATSAGSYLCLAEVWNNTYIVNKEIHFHMAVLGSAKQGIKFVSKGDSVFLPCIINASNNIYPQPVHIEWWKESISCDLFECGGDIMQDGSLLLINVTANVSYHCVVHWSNKMYNASYHHIVIHQSNAHHVSVYPESLKARVGESVQFVCAVSGVGQNYSIKWYNDYNPENVINHSHVLDIHHVELNDSGDYYCEVSNEHGGHNSTLAVLKVVEPLEPPTIADFKDLLVDPNVLDNVTLNCSFTGHPIPAVYWMRVLEGFTYQYFNDSTVITGNTAVLSLSNALKHLGSYQCVAVNEAGYVSRTARVLPKGWTNPAKNFSATIIDNENYTVRVLWDLPDYDGGIPVYCYKLILYDRHTSRAMEEETVLEDCLNATTYLWNNLKEHNHSGSFTIQFGIIVTDVFKNNRSVIELSEILTEQSLPTSLNATLKVDCTNGDVYAKWELMKRHTGFSDDIIGYCLDYQCHNRSLEEKCFSESGINHTTITGLPPGATCWFNLLVLSRKSIYSNNISCHINNNPSLVSLSSSELVTSYVSSFSTLDISATSSSKLLSHSFISSVISPSSVVNNLINISVMSSSQFLSPVSSLTTMSTGNGTSDTSSNKTRNEDSVVWVYVLLLVFVALLTLLGLSIIMTIILKERKAKRTKCSHEPLKNTKIQDYEHASDFDDNIKDAFSDTETITIDGDKQSIYDTMQYCDTEKMYKKILNSATSVSLPSITGSNIDFNEDSDSGEATSSRGCASHYYKPNGVENSSVQAHQYDSSGNSIIDNDTSQMDEGSSTKIIV